MHLSPIVELRQYTLHPGSRDVLIDLFDREFIETQEVLGMRVIGQFRDLDDPDRFVWIRGFDDMPRREEGLRSFYTGPVWKQHRALANSTMIDSDNVLLLHPASPGSGFSPDGFERPAPGSTVARPGMVVAAVHSIDASEERAYIDFAEGALANALASHGAALLAYFVTETTPNNYPALPVREGEHVFVWFAGFSEDTASGDDGPDHLDMIRVIPGAPGAEPPIQVLRLSPTSRSALTGASGACISLID